MYVNDCSWHIDNNGVEPREWFEDVIRRIPEYENGRSDVNHLLPKNWKANFKDFNQR